MSVRFCTFFFVNLGALSVTGLWHDAEPSTTLGNPPSHMQALHLYAHKLNDYSKAVAYCQALYDPDSPATKDVYLQLFKIYLQPIDSEPAKVRNVQVPFGLLPGLF